MYSPSLPIPKYERVLLLEDQSVIPGGSKCYSWGINHIWSSEDGKNQFSSLPDYSSPYWVPLDRPKKSVPWSSPPFFLSLMVFSACPKVPCSSSKLLFFPLSGAGHWWRWWCSVCFRSCTQREGRSWRKLIVFKYSESITLVCYFVKCLDLFSLHFKDPLLLGFVARFAERWFCSQSQKGRVKGKQSPPPVLLQN